MKIAVISPISHLRYCEYGDIHMALTHLVLENKDYAAYYKRKSDEGEFVILDNSAFELEQKMGKGLGPEPVYEAARIIHPSEVIATDVLLNKDETLKSTQAFIDYWKSAPDIGKPVQIMAVVQGQNQQEWLDCFEALYQNPDICTLGISKISAPHCFLTPEERVLPGYVAEGRIKALFAVEHHFNIQKTLGAHSPLLGQYGLKELHLLGGDNWNGYELSVQKNFPMVRSCDSSCSTWYGSLGHRFDNSGKISQLVMTKPDLENEIHITAMQMTEAEKDILHNIAILHKMSK